MRICYVLRESLSLIRLCFVEVIHVPEYRFLGNKFKVVQGYSSCHTISVIFIDVYYALLPGGKKLASSCKPRNASHERSLTVCCLKFI